MVMEDKLTIKPPLPLPRSGQTFVSLFISLIIIWNKDDGGPGLVYNVIMLILVITMLTMYDHLLVKADEKIN